MNIDGDFTVTGHETIAGTLNVDGDLNGSGTLNVGGTLNVDGNVEGSITINAATVNVGGDVSGSVTINAATVNVKGDVEDAVTINAAAVNVEGDREAGVSINALAVNIGGEDETQPAENEDYNGPVSDGDIAGGDIIISGVRSGYSGSSVSNMSINGTNISSRSDGSISCINGKVTTAGATSTRIKINDNVLEVEGGDIDRNGVVRTGTVKVNGQTIERNSPAGVDLSLLDGEVGRVYKDGPDLGNSFSRMFRF